jgi:hypothetical protein
MFCRGIAIFARVRIDGEPEHGRAIARTAAKRYCPIVCLALLATAWAFSYSLNAQESETSTPRLDLIFDNLERGEEQTAALSRPYEVARQYLLFRRDDRKPFSEVNAQISFADAHWGPEERGEIQDRERQQGNARESVAGHDQQPPI